MFLSKHLPHPKEKESSVLTSFNRSCLNNNNNNSPVGPQEENTPNKNSSMISSSPLSNPESPPISPLVNKKVTISSVSNNSMDAPPSTVFGDSKEQAVSQPANGSQCLTEIIDVAELFQKRKDSVTLLLPSINQITTKNLKPSPLFQLAAHTVKLSVALVLNGQALAETEEIEVTGLTKLNLKFPQKMPLKARAREMGLVFKDDPIQLKFSFQAQQISLEIISEKFVLHTKEEKRDFPKQKNPRAFVRRLELLIPNQISASKPQEKKKSTKIQSSQKVRETVSSSPFPPQSISSPSFRTNSPQPQSNTSPLPPQQSNTLLNLAALSQFSVVESKKIFWKNFFSAISQFQNDPALVQTCTDIFVKQEFELEQILTFDQNGVWDKLGIEKIKLLGPQLAIKEAAQKNLDRRQLDELSSQSKKFKVEKEEIL